MKYQVKFSDPSTDPDENARKLAELSFEQDDKTYRQGDVFEPPAFWRLNMNGFDGYGVRFEEPYKVYDDDAGKLIDKGDWHNVILPLVPMSEEKKERTPKGG